MTKTKNPLLEIKHLSKSYGEKVILDDINLNIPRHQIIGLLGQNGAGKSTLIKLINDLLTPTSGEILFEGQPIGVESKKRISYLPEHTYLDKTIYIRNALKFFAEFYNNFNLQKAETLIQDFELNPDMKISKMSKGMQEKLQLILVMSREADLYILDEPLGGVDPATRDYVLDTILTNFNQDASILISTHLIADIERILDEVIFIKHGKVTLQSSADALREKYHTSIDQVFRQTFKTKNH